MNTYSDKAQENKSQSMANTVSQRQNSGESTFKFVDNRPEAIAQRKLQAMADNYSAQRNHHIQKKENNTGLPDTLKSGIENLSGYSMDDLKVHYNSDKPTQLQAHAYAQGTDIHLAPGQEKHLPHEAWHIVQQKQGRVRPTMQMKGKVNINDDAGLEKEADVMGAKAFQFVDNRSEAIVKRKFNEVLIANPVQLKQSIITQRQEITEDEALEALDVRGGSFNRDNTEIRTPWGDEDDDSNCHGYTLNEATGHYATPEQLLEEIGVENNIAVFMRGNVIAHSGFYTENSLTHFLIGIGICHSTIGLDDTAGYDHRYNLPNDREELDEVLNTAAIEATADQRREYVERILGYASDCEIPTNGDVNIFHYQDLDDIAKDEFIQQHLVEINQIREALNAHLQLIGAEENFEEV